jgi:hypothetical protein
MGSGGFRDRYRLAACGVFYLVGHARNGANRSLESMRTKLPTLVPTGELERSKGHWRCWPVNRLLANTCRQGRAVNLSDSNRDFAGYGLPVLVTRSPGEG